MWQYDDNIVDGDDSGRDDDPGDLEGGFDGCDDDDGHDDDDRGEDLRWSDYAAALLSYYKGFLGIGRDKIRLLALHLISSRC